MWPGPCSSAVNRALYGIWAQWQAGNHRTILLDFRRRANCELDSQRPDFAHGRSVAEGPPFEALSTSRVSRRPASASRHSPKSPLHLAGQTSTPRAGKTFGKHTPRRRRPLHPPPRRTNRRAIFHLSNAVHPHRCAPLLCCFKQAWFLRV